MQLCRIANQIVRTRGCKFLPDFCDRELAIDLSGKKQINTHGVLN
jgi:hypothetical protein